MMEPREQIRTALFLVPFVVRNRGVKATDLAARLGLSLRELEQQLELLMLVGRPPFTPDALIDIYQEGGMVYVDLAQSLKKPPQLNAFETLALAAAIRPFAEEEMAGPAAVPVKKALEKIRRALPAQLLPWLEQVSRQVLLLLEYDNWLAQLKRALDERLEVEITYLTAERTEKTRRTVCPYGLVNHQGVWYLAGWCRLRDQPRVFRVSRILELELSDRIFDPPPADFDAEKFVRERVQPPQRGRTRIVIRFSSRATPWVAERWPRHFKRLAGGRAQVEFYDLSPEYVCALVASFGGEAEIVEPVEWGRLLEEQARQALAAYEDLNP